MIGGVVLLWVVLTVVTGTWLPGTSYLFAWPALAGLFVMMWRPGNRPANRRSPLTRLVVVALPTIVLLVPPIETFYQMAQPRPGTPDSEIVETVALAIAFAVLAFALITSLAGSRTRTTARTPSHPH